MLDELVNGPPGARRTQNKGMKGKENHVSQRVRDWERERERLREISRLEEIERERDVEPSDSSDPEERGVVDITPELEQTRPSERAAQPVSQMQVRATDNGVQSTPTAIAGSWSPSDIGMDTSASRMVPVFSEPTPAATLSTTFLPEVVVSPTVDSPHKSSHPNAEPSKRPNSSSGRATFRHAIKRSIDLPNVQDIESDGKKLPFEESVC
ncbi:hypothetical protein J3R30DRAFT_2152467 [Lentinula aciculospora]|uniref:Uncharacterized protein n=1 Tax=Lentinula aciculospora TaxID=153920 RepID=A0A9W9DRH6_9AGAR|nr:hypothetical protein J3R30DRAFT_2152467 [Lentinula aciculospora]